MKRFIIHFLLTYLLSSTTFSLGQFNASDSTKSTKEHTLIDELSIFYDISFLPSYLEDTYCAQISSYDTTGGNDDGFSGRYSYIRRNIDNTLVIFDQKGSGVINRIWTPTPNNDTLDFYIDDDIKPAFSIRFIDLFSGDVYPFVRPLCGNQLGGYYCYFPILFNKSCKIVSRGDRIQFHQIQYRLFEKGAKTKSFKPSLAKDEKEAFAKIAILWDREHVNLNDLYPNLPVEAQKKITLRPGETISLYESHKGGRILGFELQPSNSFEGLSKDIDIKITWDDEKNPSVYCPVADFFGYAFGYTSMQSLLLGSYNDINYCYIPMPFDRNAKLELIYRENKNTKQNDLTVTSRFWSTSRKRETEKEGKFYTHWNKDILPPIGEPHVFLDIKGKGHYIGTILQAQGKKAGMTYFFEGDDSTAIDGEFRMHGTGSEDYFNGGWYAMMDRWDNKMSLPLHGSLDYSLPFCRTGGYRFFLPDKISFQECLFHSIEHGPSGNAFPVDYTSLALYYADSPIIAFNEPDNELSQVYIPDTLILFPQLMDFNLFGDIDVKTSWKYGTGGESYLFTPDGESWLRIGLDDIPTGHYTVYLDIIEGPSGCEFSLWQRQTQVSDWISTYNIDKEVRKQLFIGDLDNSKITHTLTFKFRTYKQQSGLLLNRIILVNAD